MNYGKGKYRDAIKDNTHYQDEIAEGSAEMEYVDEIEVTKIIDELERDINEIYDRLDDIKGISEIDDIKYMVKKISDYLY